VVVHNIIPLRLKIRMRTSSLSTSRNYSILCRRNRIVRDSLSRGRARTREIEESPQVWTAERKRRLPVTATGLGYSLRDKFSGYPAISCFPFGRPFTTARGEERSRGSTRQQPRRKWQTWRHVRFCRTQKDGRRMRGKHVGRRRQPVDEEGALTGFRPTCGDR
jgi:hypothetical protein